MKNHSVKEKNLSYFRKIL